MINRISDLSKSIEHGIIDPEGYNHRLLSAEKYYPV
jgi:hypothetical protein